MLGGRLVPDGVSGTVAIFAEKRNFSTFFSASYSEHTEAQGPCAHGAGALILDM